MKKGPFKLDPEEQQIEDEAEKYRPVAGEKRKQPEKMLYGDKETTMMSIRVPVEDIKAIREKAEKLGIPYQTLIKSLLHQYAETPAELSLSLEVAPMVRRTIFEAAKQAYQELATKN
jgi:predicted DNA binding CopG/RHH family protein